MNISYEIIYEYQHVDHYLQINLDKNLDNYNAIHLNLLLSFFQGCFIVSIFLCAFISLVWLREQIIHGGPQEWLNVEDGVRGANAENALDDNIDVAVSHLIFYCINLNFHYLNF